MLGERASCLNVEFSAPPALQIFSHSGGEDLNVEPGENLGSILVLAKVTAIGRPDRAEVKSSFNPLSKQSGRAVATVKRGSSH